MNNSNRKLPSKAACEKLPQHVLELIIIKTSQCGGELGEQSILSLRLVSKFWKAAIAECSGRADLILKRPTDLFKVCKVLPGMSCLDIRSLGTQVFLHPLASCARLQTLDIFFSPAGPYWVNFLPVDLLNLPSSLRELRLSGVQVDPDAFEYLQIGGLTRLSIRGISNTVAEINQLLQRLPCLKDLFVWQRQFGHELQDFSHFLRSSSSSSSGTLLSSVDRPSYASALECLELCWVTLSVACLEDIRAQLPCLTELEFYKCEEGHNEEALIPQISTLRRLCLGYCPVRFLALASPSLQGLTCLCNAEMGNPDMRVIARLTNLTELILDTVHRSADYQTIRSIPLQKLCLGWCPEAEVALFVPGALTALRSLTFIENRLQEFHDELQVSESQGQQMGQKLRRVGEILQSLPQLTTISGMCKLFVSGMTVGQGWISKVQYGGCGKNECYCRKCLCACQKWTRVC